MRAPEIGLTGNIGSGKSTVAALLAQRGAAVIDADQLARQAVADPEVLRRIGAALGADLVRGGTLDRDATARRVFDDAEARARLDAIVHPVVRAARRRQAEALQRRAPRPPLIVHDVPLLFEADLQGCMDATLVVTAPLETRVQRVSERSGMAPEEVRAREANQLPLAAKAARADYVVDNGGSEAELARRVDALWPHLVSVTSRRG